MSRWLRSLVILIVSSLFVSAADSSTFENSAIVRTVDLGGALVHVTTTYAAKALKSNVDTYTIAMGFEELDQTSWLEFRLKGQSETLTLSASEPDTDGGCQLLEFKLPKAIESGSVINLVAESVQAHATWPWPPTAAQQDEQAVKYKTGLLVLSPYHTRVQRTKLKSPSATIRSYTTPNVSFTTEDSVTKSGATVTYGPYSEIPPSTSKTFAEDSQQPVIIHYNYDYPIAEITKLVRSAEISHWGSNLNIQDDISLRNAGPALKGHFSRLAHQAQSFYQRSPPHTIPSLTLHLPAGIRNTYYYDLIGNVSTSHLRVAPSTKSLKKQHSVMELRPRYPILGGWNYTFTLGWDAPLGDSVVYDKNNGAYIAQIPIMTEVPGAVVDEAEVRIILPEGATAVEYAAPFPAVMNVFINTITYLDTVGRPTLVFKYRDLTDKHAKSIYVTYKVPLAAHLKKPMAVSIAFFAFFTFALFTRRVNLTIHKKKV